MMDERGSRRSDAGSERQELWAGCCVVGFNLYASEVCVKLPRKGTTSHYTTCTPHLTIIPPSLSFPPFSQFYAHFCPEHNSTDQLINLKRFFDNCRMQGILTKKPDSQGFPSQITSFVWFAEAMLVYLMHIFE